MMTGHCYLKDTMNLKGCFALILLAGFHQIKAMVLTNISVPRVVDFRDRVTLSCSYEMGSHKLNSVKWYKDGLEFFRYSPMMDQPFITFPVKGVTISRNKKFCNQFTCSIELDALEARSSGAYRCEVSGDAPEFKLISQTANMTVAALPRNDPIITGLTDAYRFDDFVVANCTSDWSSPPAMLSWYINDKRATPEMLQPQQETTLKLNRSALHSRTLEIRFHIDKTRFINSERILKMKCLADIPKIPSLVRERTILADILSQDDLNNQKLVIGNGSDRQQYTPKILIFLSWIIQSFSLVLSHTNGIPR